MDYSGKQAKVKLRKHYYSTDIFTGVITTELVLLEPRSRVINHLSQNIRDLFKEKSASTCRNRLGTRGLAKEVQEKHETLHHAQRRTAFSSAAIPYLGARSTLIHGATHTLQFVPRL